jgi:hypothetical protein
VSFAITLAVIGVILLIFAGATATYSIGSAYEIVTRAIGMLGGLLLLVALIFFISLVWHFNPAPTQ